MHVSIGLPRGLVRGLVVKVTEVDVGDDSGYGVVNLLSGPFHVLVLLALVPANMASSVLALSQEVYVTDGGF